MTHMADNSLRLTTGTAGYRYRIGFIQRSVSQGHRAQRGCRVYIEHCSTAICLFAVVGMYSMPQAQRPVTANVSESVSVSAFAHSAPSEFESILQRHTVPLEDGT